MIQIKVATRIPPRPNCLNLLKIGNRPGREAAAWPNARLAVDRRTLARDLRPLVRQRWSDVKLLLAIGYVEVKLA